MVNMTETKKILNLALPAMVENILQILMGLVDSYLVAQISLIAVSGVSLANNLIAIYQALFIALSAAVSGLVAHSQRTSEKVARYRSQSLSLTLVLSILLGVFSLIGGKWILTFLGAEKQVVIAGGLYLATVGGGVISLGVLIILGAILRAQGQSRLPMYASLLANLANAILSALAVFVFDLGIVGVAVATVFSRFLGILVLLPFLPMKEMIGGLTWRWDKKLINRSLPAAGERLMMRLGDVVVVALIVGLGTEVVAGNSIGETLTQFNYMPGLAFATATIILVAGSPKNQHKSLIRKIYLMTSLSMLAVSLVAYLLSFQLIELFTGNSGAQAASFTVLFYSMLGSFATSGTLIYTALWQGLGNSSLPFYATTIGMWVVRILLGYVLVHKFRLGLSGVWIATIADNAWRFAFLHWKFQKIKK